MVRVSRFLFKTLREDPSDAESPSHKLMLKSGMISQVAAGIYNYQPLALKSIQKIEGIIREEMNAAGGIEVRMPGLQPIELWQKSGREALFGLNLFRLDDRRDRRLVLAPTHEEVATHIVSANVSSYRDLPALLYQIQTKFRDEARPRAGLLRGREFDMKDAYSFDADSEGLDSSYQRMVEAYEAIFKRCGFPVLQVEADSGAIGGKDSAEFIMPTNIGEDTVFICPQGDYAANIEKASATRQGMDMQKILPLEMVPTPGAQTIKSVADLLGVGTHQTLKTLVYWADGQILLVAIRGDLEVNEVKLKNMLKASEVRLATKDEVENAGLVSGYISPIGLDRVHRIGDHSLVEGANFIIGANQDGCHYKNANYPRDFEVDDIGDIAFVTPGDLCRTCGSPLQEIRGMEVGHVFKLGTRFSESFGANFLDSDGSLNPILMGCYGIGVTRILAAAIEQNHDDNGIVFPVPIAPFDVHLVTLNVNDTEVSQMADGIYELLLSSGFDVLYDDRFESPGVKFNDADLIGLPVRVTVSRRNLDNNEIEIKMRSSGDSVRVHPSELKEAVAKLLE